MEQKSTRKPLRQQAFSTQRGTRTEQKSEKKNPFGHQSAQGKKEKPLISQGLFFGGSERIRTIDTSGMNQHGLKMLVL